MRNRVLASILGALLLSACATAQTGGLDIPSYAHLARKASDSTSLTIPGPILRFAARVSDAEHDSDPGMRLLARLERVEVRSYEFDRDDAYSQDDVDVVLRQLHSPQWSQIVKVRNPKAREHVDVFIRFEQGKPQGIAIVAAEPREFTVVNIVGSIDLEQLAQVKDQLGMSKIAWQQ